MVGMGLFLADATDPKPSPLTEPGTLTLGMFRVAIERLKSYNLRPETPMYFPPGTEWMPTPRRQGRTLAFQQAIEQALATGEHVHSFGRDGLRCISGECE